MALTAERVRRTLGSGSVADRQALVDALPHHPLRATARAMMKSRSPATLVAVLAALARRYCFGASPSVGAALAAGLHARGCEIARRTPDHGLLAVTLSGLALAHVGALTQLSRFDELLAASAHYLSVQDQLLARCRDPDCEQNTATLRLFRVEALLALARHDEAAATLRAHPELFADPANALEARRLHARLEAARGTALPRPRPSCRLDVSRSATSVGRRSPSEEILR
ncbi:MAG TPA: hypothetical protein VK698_15520 [Kofleriaceae bacterium]|nr:hypothetical protein [Kofleriaceae bacterium]